MGEQRYVITGPPGSGKTAVLRELARRGFAIVEEPARAVIAQQRASRGDDLHDKDPRLFWQLMFSRAISDFQQAHGSSGPVFFDRGIPDLIGYAELFGLDPSEATSAADTYRYSKIVFEFPSWPEIYTTDRDRRMTVAEAASFGGLVRRSYIEHRYTVVDVARETIAARADFIVDSLRRSRNS